jgi:hypothetical protein
MCLVGLKTKEVTVLPERVKKYGKWIPGTDGKKGYWEPIVIAAFKVKDVAVCSSLKATMDMKGHKIKRKKIPVLYTSVTKVNNTLVKSTKVMNRSTVTKCDEFTTTKAKIKSSVVGGNPFNVITPEREGYERSQKKRNVPTSCTGLRFP